jgi:hypothetical protein
MLTCLTFRWGSKYGPDHVERLKAGIARNLSMAHRFLCVGDDIPIEDHDLLAFRDGCYARLRAFDPEWQARHGIERLVWLDLDMVIVGALDPLFARPEPLVVLTGNHWNPCRVNGSVLMMQAGARPDIWTGFNLKEADRIAHADGTWRGSDQTWIAHKAPDAPAWTFKDGIYGYEKRGWPGHLPEDARIVTFNGKRDPSRQSDDWVRQHWAG